MRKPGGKCNCLAFYCILLASIMADHVLSQHCPVPFTWTRLLGLLPNCPASGVTLLRIKINKLIIMMFHLVLNTTGIFQKISYTLWNTSLILSDPPSLLGQCPKFDRIFFFTAFLRWPGVWCGAIIKIKIQIFLSIIRHKKLLGKP